MENDFKDRSDIVRLLRSSLDNPSGCWKDYNNAYKTWQAINRLTKVSGPIRPLVENDEVPDEPDIDDWSNLDPDCE